MLKIRITFVDDPKGNEELKKTIKYVDAHQFYHMTQDKIDTWREKNIRGFKRK